MSERRILAVWIGLVVGSWAAVGLVFWGIWRLGRWLAMLGLSAWVLAAVPAQAQDVPSSVRVAQGVFIAAQVADWHSTKVAIDHGAVEANPVMRGSDTKRLALKAGMTAGIVWATSHLSRTRPTAAKWMLYVASGLTAGVAANNYRIAFSVGVPRG